MDRRPRLAQACLAALISSVALGSFPQAHDADHRPVNGTIWVANTAATPSG